VQFIVRSNSLGSGNIIIILVVNGITVIVSPWPKQQCSWKGLYFQKRVPQFASSASGVSFNNVTYIIIYLQRIRERVCVCNFSRTSFAENSRKTIIIIYHKVRTSSVRPVIMTCRRVSRSEFSRRAYRKIIIIIANGQKSRVGPAASGLTWRFYFIFHIYIFFLKV